MKRNLSFQSKNDNESNYRNNSLVIRAKNNSKNIVHEINSSREKIEKEENNIHRGLLNLNLNNIASDKKKN